ncbi:MAG: hypothetical protein WCT16_02525 [Candidatus Buchananbacteria bacterium]
MAMSVKRLVDLVGLRMAYKIAEKRFISIESFLKNLTFADLEAYLEHFHSNFGDFDLFTDPLKHRLMETASSFSDWHKLYRKVYSGRDWERVIIDSLVKTASTLEELMIVSDIMLICASRNNDRKDDPELAEIDADATIRQSLLRTIEQKTQKFYNSDVTTIILSMRTDELRLVFSALCCIYNNADLESELSPQLKSEFIQMRDKALIELRSLATIIT